MTEIDRIKYQEPRISLGVIRRAVTASKHPIYVSVSLTVEVTTSLSFSIRNIIFLKECIW